MHHFFSPDEYEEGYSLSIVDGQDGSRLSHSHERQFYFALQSLTLWRDIIDDMFRLWAMAEQDLLSESMSYALQDTGQGHQRVQQSPQTYKSMQMILCRVQRKVNQWVGSNVIHLGDHNVPNALMFIDKYTQGEKKNDEYVTFAYILYGPCVSHHTHYCIIRYNQSGSHLLSLLISSTKNFITHSELFREPGKNLRGG